MTDASIDRETSTTKIKCQSMCRRAGVRNFTNPFPHGGTSGLRPSTPGQVVPLSPPRASSGAVQLVECRSGTAPQWGVAAFDTKHQPPTIGQADFPRRLAGGYRWAFRFIRAPAHTPLLRKRIAVHECWGLVQKPRVFGTRWTALRVVCVVASLQAPRTGCIARIALHCTALHSNDATMQKRTVLALLGARLRG
jgi:hypothetical protein